MRSVIRQSVELPAPAESLFDMYLDAKSHSAITGMPVTIGAERGDRFEAFDGQLCGAMLEVIKPRLIVQSWRSAHFRESDPDSTLILSFVSAAEAGRIDLIHLDVPDHDFDGVTQGWEKYYWTPWREYLKNR